MIVNTKGHRELFRGLIPGRATSASPWATRGPGLWRGRIFTTRQRGWDLFLVLDVIKSRIQVRVDTGGSGTTDPGQGRSEVSLQENPVPSQRCSHSLRVH